jgi:indolepyruvate ferredoxin oxidoreductase beta subunit
MNYDIYLVGVGGQGLLTIADLITRAAAENGISANYYPTKGMAQRGGFVKAQVRLGRERVGPQIPENGADLAISMELSEAFKAIRYLKPGGEFLLLNHVWQPTGVMLGKGSYPSLTQLEEQVENAGATLQVVEPTALPRYGERSLPANIVVLGAAVGRTRLGTLLSSQVVADLVAVRWKRNVEANKLAFQAGLDST